MMMGFLEEPHVQSTGCLEAFDKRSTKTLYPTYTYPVTVQVTAASNCVLNGCTQSRKSYHSAAEYLYFPQIDDRSTKQFDSLGRDRVQYDF